MSPAGEPRRRYVTGVRDGTADFVVAEDFPGEAASALAGHRRAVVWGSDEILRVPNDGAEPPRAQYFPPPPGWRVVIAELPGGYGVGAGEPAAESSAVVRASDGSDRLVLDAIGELHATASVDVVVVMSGELTARLEGGRERTLHAGDTLVQNGLPHAWVNRTDHVATIAVVVIAATGDEL